MSCASPKAIGVSKSALLFLHAPLGVSGLVLKAVHSVMGRSKLKIRLSLACEKADEDSIHNDVEVTLLLDHWISSAR